MQSVNRGRSQFSLVLQLDNTGHHESPRLAEDKLDELVELFSENIEGSRAEVTRYGTKETKYQNKLCWDLEPNNPWEYDALAVLMSMIGKKS